MLTSRQRPKVFLSFAGNDRPMARRLADDLLAYGVETLIDARDTEPGADIMLWIDQALSESDYCVLLWSRHADGPWVTLEWAAALARGLNERRSFLFVVRLDESPLPLLLSVRRFLDGFQDWSAISRELAKTWRADLAAGTPVFPQPDPEQAAETPAVVVLVRNWDLRVTHTVCVPSESTGADLLPAVRTTLALPDPQSYFGGAVKVRFSYRLLRNGDPIPDTPIAAQGIADNTVLDLEVDFETSGPNGSTGEMVFRDPSPSGAPSRVPDKAVRAIVRDAFGHLLP